MGYVPQQPSRPWPGPIAHACAYCGCEDKWLSTCGKCLNCGAPHRRSIFRARPSNGVNLSKVPDAPGSWIGYLVVVLVLIVAATAVYALWLVHAPVSAVPVPVEAADH